MLQYAYATYCSLPGDSGAPVLDKAGTIIGMNAGNIVLERDDIPCETRNQKSFNPGYFYPLSAIFAQLEATLGPAGIGVGFSST